jgi:hypothetical protein
MVLVLYQAQKLSRLHYGQTPKSFIFTCFVAYTVYAT